MQPIDLTALITQAYWPAIALACVVLFRKPINTILRERKIQLTLPNDISASITTETAKNTLTKLFTEFYVIYNSLLRPADKEYFEKILNSETKLHVRELIEDFDRENKEHIGVLRALRGLGLIQPKDGGSWKSESVIEVTSFGKIFVEHLKLNKKNA